MGTDVGVFLITAGVIVVAGTWLSHFADELAEATGLGRLLIGSILLAGATSLPELSVDVSAIRAGMTDLAVGDLMGSCLFNLLILAVLDLTVHSRGRLLSHQAARHALSGNVSALAMGLFGLALLSRPVLGEREVVGISYGLFPILLAYALGVRLVYYDQRASRLEASPPSEPQPAPKPWTRSALGFALAAAVIIVAGPFLSHSAGHIAEATGLGKTFVGTTMVAFSTSLPELVASLAALRMGAYDLAIGNIFGSNAFNMLLMVVLDLVHTGPLLAAVSPGHAITCVAAIIATLIVVLGQLYQVEARKRLIEPDAGLVILVVLAALWLVSQLGGGT